MAQVVVVGSSIVDMTTIAAGLPRPGETRAGSRFVSGFGGKGANQAAMVAKLGGTVAMVSRLGDDAMGRDYRANFASLGIDDRFVKGSAEAATGVASIWVDELSGANQIIVVLGINELLSPADIDQAADVIAASKVVVCQWEVPLPAVEAALRAGRAAGATTIFNPAPCRGPLPDDVIALCDYICPNEIEAAMLCGTDDPRAAARTLVGRGARHALITLGERGALLIGEGIDHHEAAIAVTALDTTGAGDAFVGSFAHYLAEGAPPIDALRAANRVAALSVTRLGAQASFPTAAEL